MEAGHTLLAKLGKKRLRPGGRLATEWLQKQVKIEPETEVLEVACNMGTTAIELVRKFGCSIVACDLDENALNKARMNVKEAGFQNKITLRQENAMDLSFEDSSFDIVMNEAMLTMLSTANKEKAISQYYRVLKPGGTLLTHDIIFRTANLDEQKQITKELAGAIHVSAQPLTEEKWKALFQSAGFSNVSTFTGDMSLMTPKGMIYDEGITNAMKVVFRGLTGQNREMFLGMSRIFRKWQEKLGFIAVCSQK